MTGNPFKPQFSIIDLDKRGKVEVIRVTIQHKSKSVIFLVVVSHHLRIYAIRIYGMHHLDCKFCRFGCTVQMKNAGATRAKLLSFIVKYVNFLSSSSS